VVTVKNQNYIYDNSELRISLFFTTQEIKDFTIFMIDNCG